MPIGQDPGASEGEPPSGPATRALPTLGSRLQAARVGAWWDRRVLKFLVLWVVVSPVAALLVYALLFPAEHRLDLLSREGVATTGVVTEAGGDTVRYKFRAESREYRGEDTPRAPNRAAGLLQDGERISISYDPADPGTSCACNPKLLERPPTGWAYLVWFAVGLAGVAAYIYQRELRRLGRWLAGRARELRERRSSGGLGALGPRRGQEPADADPGHHPLPNTSRRARRT